MMANIVSISIKPLPLESWSWRRISGKMPYLAGENNALCTPISARTASGKNESAGET